jgi:hypothetical protein
MHCAYEAVLLRFEIGIGGYIDEGWTNISRRTMLTRAFACFRRRGPSYPAGSRISHWEVEFDPVMLWRLPIPRGQPF